MDQWAQLYWDRLGHTFRSQQENVGDYGDVEHRKELRRQLECRVCDVKLLINQISIKQDFPRISDGISARSYLVLEIFTL